MACKKCGGKGTSSTVLHLTVYEVQDTGERTVKIGASSPILLRMPFQEDIVLNAGKVTKVSEAAAANLLKQEAPIWKIS